VITRDGTEKHVSVKLDAASPDKVARGGDEPERDSQAALGLSVAPLTPELANRFKLPRNTQGLIVEDVDPNGRAADAGIEPGDVIQQVNRQPVQTVEDLRSAVRKSPERPVVLLVNREGRGLFVTVRPRNG
jgi:S1-C subfamily serine protease